MRAVVISRPGDPEVLELRDVPEPTVHASHILVRVEASAVNRADLLQRRGRYPVPQGFPTDIPGLEYAGVVERTGPGATRWRVGDRVMGIIGGGAYAELVTVHEDEALAIPEWLDTHEAAALPEVFITADDALFTIMSLVAGETVVVHAAASGVGTAALQLARAVGATTIGTSRSAAKLKQLEQFGLHHPINASAEDWVGAVQRMTGGRGADCILDLVGGSYMSGNVLGAAARGRIALVGLTAGAEATIDLSAVLRKRLRITGTVMRARSLAEKIDAACRFESRWRDALDRGTIKPVIDRILPMSRVADAHHALEKNETIGKIVLRWQ